MAAMAMAAAVLVQEPGRNSAPADDPDRSTWPTESLWQMMIYRPALLPFFTMLIVVLTYGSIISFLPLLAYRNNVNPGIFFSVYAILLIVSRPLGGKIADVAGRSAAISRALPPPPLPWLCLPSLQIYRTLLWVQRFTALALRSSILR